MVPRRVGRGYDIRPATKPIADFGVEADISIVTGMKIPWGPAGSIPPGGREMSTVHYRTVGCLVAGTNALGPSCDQIVAKAVGKDVLAYRVQRTGGPISYRSPGKNGAVTPIGNPRIAYDALFEGFSPSAGAMVDPQQRLRATQLLRQRQSVLDVVRAGTNRLMGRLGAADRQRMQQHMDQIRDLEIRVNAINLDAAPSASGASRCSAPKLPGDLSREPEIQDAFNRIIAMSFACDLSRVASIAITERKCYMPLADIGLGSGTVHNKTHSGGDQPALSGAIAFGVKQLAQLTRLLRDTPDSGGTSVLDHAAMVLVFEAGLGLDPSSGRLNRTHSTEGMNVLIAGRAGRLRSGQHVLGRNRHPAAVVLTAMQACGVTTDRLGDVKETVPELLS
jgi:hypothetical protein